MARRAANTYTCALALLPSVAIQGGPEVSVLAGRLAWGRRWMIERRHKSASVPVRDISPCLANPDLRTLTNRNRSV